MTSFEWTQHATFGEAPRLDLWSNAQAQLAWERRNLLSVGMANVTPATVHQSRGPAWGSDDRTVDPDAPAYLYDDAPTEALHEAAQRFIAERRYGTPGIALFGHPNLGAATTRLLFDSYNGTKHSARCDDLAFAPNVDQDIADMLWRKNRHDTRFWMAANPSSSPETLKRAVRAAGSKTALAVALIQNPSLPTSDRGRLERAVFDGVADRDPKYAWLTGGPFRHYEEITYWEFLGVDRHFAGRDDFWTADVTRHAATAPE